MATLSSHSPLDSFSSGMPLHHNHHAYPHQQHHQQQHLPLPLATMPAQRRRGVTKFFNSLKGYGFAVDQHPEELGGQEVFVHFSAISGKGGFRSLAEGEEVEYELVQGPKGFQAANLTGPGGRNVVGDPKARLTKPPTYMPFAPLSMPLSSQYMSDPYQQQHNGVYSGSPYTQHVVYVPSSMHSTSQSLPAGSQYPYSTMSPHTQGLALHSGAPGAGDRGGVSTGDLASAFNGLNLSSAAPSQHAYATYQSHSPSQFPSGPPSASVASQHPVGRNVSNFGSFSPPGGSYLPLGGEYRSGGTGGGGKLPGGGGGLPTTFAPFNSPPPFSNPPLFGEPAGAFPSAVSNSTAYRSSSPLGSGGVPFALTSLPSSSSTSSSLPRSASGASGTFPSNGTSSLFGGSSTSSTGVGAVGAVGAPRTTTSRAGTPRDTEQRRGTPLGNGTLSGSGGFGPVLYTSGSGDFSS